MKWILLTFFPLVFGNWVIERAPYILILLHDNNNTCGGVLVKEDVALTAARCVQNKEGVYEVRGGSSFISRGIRRGIKKIIVHPEYSPETANNDFAILLLDSPYKVSKNLKPIQIYDDRDVQVGQFVRVTGWESLDVERQRGSLRFADVPLIDNSLCNDKEEKDLHVTSSKFCVGNLDDEDEYCVGHSGDPVVRDGMVYGLISTGTRYCTGPDVFTKITAFKDFLTKEAGIEFKGE